jgi:short-subunit dehydrogenase
MTEGLYAELLDTAVGASVVMPGAVATGIADNSGVEIDTDVSPEDMERRTTSPEKAAEIIVDGIEKDHLHVFVGRDSLMMGALNRLAPKWSTHLITKQMEDLLQ